MGLLFFIIPSGDYWNRRRPCRERNAKSFRAVGTTGGRPLLETFHSYLQLNLSSTSVILRYVARAVPYAGIRYASRGGAYNRDVNGRPMFAPTEKCFATRQRGTISCCEIVPYGSYPVNLRLFRYSYDIQKGLPGQSFSSPLFCRGEL